MPIYEFSCSECGAEFEELTGPHVGLDAESVCCPECGASRVERLPTSSYSPIHRRLTTNERKKLESSRSVDRAARKAEFKRKRKAVRDARNNSGGPG